MQQTHFAGWNELRTATHIGAGQVVIATPRDLQLLVPANGDILIATGYIHGYANAAGPTNVKLRITLDGAASQILAELDTPDAGEYWIGWQIAFGFQGENMGRGQGFITRQWDDGADVLPKQFSTFSGNAAAALGYTVEDDQGDGDVELIAVSISRIRPGLS